MSKFRFGSLSVILETLGDHAPRSKDPILLTEYVRHRLARQICTRYRNAEGELYVVAFDPALEDGFGLGSSTRSAGCSFGSRRRAWSRSAGMIGSEIEQANGSQPLADRAR